MKSPLLLLLSAAFLPNAAEAQNATANAARQFDTGQVTSYSRGLHGEIRFGHEKLPVDGGFSASMGFYAAVWPLIDQPIANFQIGLPSSWIQPENSDNQDRPLAPEGTLARTWQPRGPTWSRDFQTVKGAFQPRPSSHPTRYDQPLSHPPGEMGFDWRPFRSSHKGTGMVR